VPKIFENDAKIDQNGARNQQRSNKMVPRSASNRPASKTLPEALLGTILLDLC
jgi:hypothetical protein